MDQKELKTSPKQRFFIILIAVLMVGSIVASYIAIVLSNGSTTGDEAAKIDSAKLAEYQKAYGEKVAEFKEKTKADFDKFVTYRSEVTAYNETTANADGLQTKDLVVGDGRELTEGDTDYLAYYIGWCADESVFDSSFDSNTSPEGFAQALDPSMGLIEGWENGVVGMILGGIREITIPGELAYKDTTEICGGTYKPLKFLVMAVPNEDPLKTLAQELTIANLRLQYASYGIDYDEMVQSVSGSTDGDASDSTDEGATETVEMTENSENAE